MAGRKKSSNLTRSNMVFIKLRILAAKLNEVVPDITPHSGGRGSAPGLGIEEPNWLGTQR